MAAGRYAPSPSGELHIGNLRTAVIAWLAARTTGRSFLLRIEDLDQQRSKPEHEASQIRDLETIGLDFDGPIVRQSERLAHYAEALSRLDTYECFCTRREVQDAPRAPHAPPGSYPGTCRDLTDQQRAAQRQVRAPAIRLRSQVATATAIDLIHGEVSGAVDDFVLVRGDGTPAYNLAVVVDDAAQGVDQVVRGSDLLTSTPRQAHLARLLGFEPPSYAHVPLVVNECGQRLAKRDGAVTLAQLTARGVDTMALIGASLGLPGNSVREWLPRFSLQSLPSVPWAFTPPR